ncbi:protein-glutamine gamma-glutamyltransferase [Pontibacillus salipaludis]|uniref:Protein-glutamine gamma-glutamyltransferase n=1 Tax=Pontibacillus salipaludis TaxID=1697394 RepID=A0ABQ1Q1G3_9BACI|nr:protein-glutamine gamma-glutamyltransferase [Pontibacillus salipaludis]GGD09738.1 protein-glutamine gamma-glutamyltransferase [Pontibacillus salipaludis]
MLQVSGSPYPTTLPVNTGPLEEEIIKGMQNSSELYSYSSMNELLFDLNVRKNTIESAEEMSEGEATFRGFRSATCNPDYWYLTPAGGFLIKPTVLPSEGIQDIYNNSSLYAYECATACVIVFYHAVLKSIGASSFNDLFQNLYLYSWNTDPDLGIYTYYANDFLPGDVVYFNNPDYDRVNANYRGENAVAMGSGKFFGHGINIVTTEEMIEFLNSKRYEGSNRSAYLTSSVTRLLVNRFMPYSNTYRTLSPSAPLLSIHHNKISISLIQHIYYLSKGSRNS